MEIANDLIPHLVKSAGLNPTTYNEVLRDPECFSYILRFYDGICMWEEGSLTPVLHIGWAKQMFSTCTKFEAEVRAKLHIPESDDERTETDGRDDKGAGKHSVRRAHLLKTSIYSSVNIQGKQTNSNEILVCSLMFSGNLPKQASCQPETEVSIPPQS